jgi:hypothetical protein
MAGLRASRFLAVALALTGWLVSAQEAPTQAEPEPDADLTLPPTLEESPGDARLEAPPEDREDVLDAVVTGGQNDWRLPDLGTSLRKQREEEAKNTNQRIEVGFLGLYDPEEDDANQDFLAPEVEVMRGLGVLKIFKVQFGRRPDD